MEQPYMTVICRSIEDKFGALDFPPSHQSPQATSANQGQPKWTTQEEFHSNETAGADSSKESLLWSKSAVITSRLSWDAVSFFRNVGNSWPQQKLNVVLSFPSRLTALVEWEWNCKCLLWWFENLCLNSLWRGKHSMQDKKKLHNHWENSLLFTADVPLISIAVFSPCTLHFGSVLWENSQMVVGGLYSVFVLWLWLLGAGSSPFYFVVKCKMLSAGMEATMTLSPWCAAVGTTLGNMSRLHQHIFSGGSSLPPASAAHGQTVLWQDFHMTSTLKDCKAGLIPVMLYWIKSISERSIIQWHILAHKSKSHYPLIRIYIIFFTL